MTDDTFDIIDPITGASRQITGPRHQIAALRKLADFVETGKQDSVPDATREALDAGLPAYEVLVNGLQAGLAVVGDRFKRDIAFIPEVLVSARAMKRGMEILKPLLTPTGQKPKGIVVLGTVKGDLHDIGKAMVGIMLEGEGYEVHDLGVNVSPEAFLEKAIEVEADLMGMSALLSTTMMMHRETINYIAEKGCRDKVKIMSGGAPVTSKFAQEIGADGYASDAATAVAVANRLMTPGWNGSFVSGTELVMDVA
ncbi:MAG: corrinoid protein [Proteobacteria bacterium]|nr:corrinoid protein [Pseudomonadota bacterium]